MSNDGIRVTPAEKRELRRIHQQHKFREAEIARRGDVMDANPAIPPIGSFGDVRDRGREPEGESGG